MENGFYRKLFSCKTVIWKTIRFLKTLFVWRKKKFAKTWFLIITKSYVLWSS
jgi:hypothetical protein